MADFRKKNAQEVNLNATNPDGTPVVRVRLPKKWNNEQFAIAQTMHGANHISVRSLDGVTLMGRIKGKIKKRAGSGKATPSLLFPGVSRRENAISSTGISNPRRTG